MSTSGEMNLITSSGTHTISVTHDGYPDGFGREILKWMQMTFAQDKSFVETIWPFSLQIEAPIEPHASGYGEWQYTVNTKSQTFEVDSHTTMGEPLTKIWSWDNLPSPKEIEEAFDDDESEW